MWAYFNYINPIEITKAQASTGCHSGDCTDDIKSLMEVPKIKRQLKKVLPDRLKTELWEYGAWTDEELNRHKDNLMRILWIACANIMDEK